MHRCQGQAQRLPGSNCKTPVFKEAQLSYAQANTCAKRKKSFKEFNP
jgi:hypothetical protein